MAQSTTNLGKIHVFPSETLYNQFKDIIADNDLALLKDDGAYIVAALLEQNGYVKFSNGLILQWGITPELTFNSTTTITYSLPLATTLYINAFMYGGGLDKCVQLPQILSQTSTSAQIYITWATDSAGYYGSVTWLAIGKQQWGYTGEQSNKITFALSYPKAVLGILVTTGDGIPQNPVDVTLSGATAVGYNSAGCKTYWLAYGIQQWGIKAASTYTWTYPLPLAVVYYADMMGYRKGSAGSEYGWIRSISLIAFETYIIDESAICFCIGIAQQWGTEAVTQNQRNVKVNYALTVRDTILIMLTTQNTSDFSYNGHQVAFDYTSTGFTLSHEGKAQTKLYFAVCIAQQWGFIEKVPTSTKYIVPLNIAITKGIYGSIVPSTAPDTPMANNAVISISANNMIVQSMQGSIASLWWLSIGFQQWLFILVSHRCLTSYS